MVGAIRPGNGSIELVEGRDRCGVRLRGLGCEEMKRGRRGLAGTELGGSSARPLRDTSARKKMKGMGNG